MSQGSKKILVLGWPEDPHFGGVGQVSKNLAIHLSRKGKHILYVLPHDEGKYNQVIVDSLNFQVIPVSAQFLGEVQNGVVGEHLPMVLSPYQNTLKAIESVIGKVIEQSFTLSNQSDIPLNTVVKGRSEMPSYQAGTTFVVEQEKSQYEAPAIPEMAYKNEQPPENWLEESIDSFSEKVVEQVENKEVEVIHSHDWYMQAVAEHVKDQSEDAVKHIAHFHSTEYDRQPPSKRDSRITKIEQHTINHADSIIVVSNYLKGVLVQQYNADAKKITTIYPGVSSGEIQLKSKINNSFDFIYKNLYSKPKIVPTENKKVLFVGRISYQKGIEHFVETAKELVRINTKVEFWIAGEGPELKTMMYKAKELGLMKYFVFMGKVPRSKIKHLFRLADVLFMPGISEPFGLVIAEAAREGLPVVVSDKTGSSEVFPSQMRAPHGDYLRFATMIKALLENNQLRQQEIDNNMKNLKKLSWSECADDFLNIMEDKLSYLNKEVL